MSTPVTCSGPSASAAIAATSDESMPPESPSTTWVNPFFVARSRACRARAPRYTSCTGSRSGSTRGGRDGRPRWLSDTATVGSGSGVAPAGGRAGGGGRGARRGRRRAGPPRTASRARAPSRRRRRPSTRRRRRARPGRRRGSRRRSAPRPARARSASIASRSWTRPAKYGDALMFTIDLGAGRGLGDDRTGRRSTRPRRP